MFKVRAILEQCLAGFQAMSLLGSEIRERYEKHGVEIPKSRALITIKWLKGFRMEKLKPSIYLVRIWRLLIPTQIMSSPI